MNERGKQLLKAAGIGKKKRPAIVRKESPASEAEMPKLASAFTWFNDMVNNERFHIVMDHLRRLKQFKSGQMFEQPHQQLIASGYLQGYDDLAENIYKVASNPPSPEELEEFRQVETREESYV